jgi:arginyl-tRNA synthetase
LGDFCVHQGLAEAISQISGVPANEILALIVRPKESGRGDFSFPAFAVAKAKKIPPPAAAAELAATIVLPPAFSRVESVGPYLNFFLDRQRLAERTLQDILTKREKCAERPSNGRKILVEYSSPNIAKVIHVGHLRTTLIGKSIDELYRALGYDVTSINHLGDWGTQFGIVFAGCEIFGRPASPGVDDLVDVYVKAANLKKEQEAESPSADAAAKPSVTTIAREFFLRLEAGDNDAIEFWNWCREGSVQYLKDVYARLGISFDSYAGESFYRDQVPAVEKILRESGFMSESRGSLGVDLGEKLGFVRVFAEDGRSLYVTRDIATALYRHEHYHPEKILYVVAHQQSLYFQQLIEVMRRLNHPVADQMVHVSFGFVPGMKTRSGGGISLVDFLREAKERALAVYREEVSKRPEGVDENEVGEKVAIGATYFYFLSNSNTKDFQFSWKEALSFQGDTGPYVQYAIARLYSVCEKAAEAGVAPFGTVDGKLLSDDLAYEVIAILAQLPEVMERAAAEYEPYYIARYCLDLSKAVSRAYRELRVVNAESAEVSTARLALFTAARYVLESAARLIGMPVLQRM